MIDIDIDITAEDTSENAGKERKSSMLPVGFYEAEIIDVAQAENRQGEKYETLILTLQIENARAKSGYTLVNYARIPYDDARKWIFIKLLKSCGFTWEIGEKIGKFANKLIGERFIALICNREFEGKMYPQFKSPLLKWEVKALGEIPQEDFKKWGLTPEGFDPYAAKNKAKQAVSSYDSLEESDDIPF